MTIPPPEERPLLLQKLLTPFAQRLAKQRQVVHVPSLIGLRTQHPGLLFHSVPELFFQFTGTNHFTYPAEHLSLNPDEMAIVSRWLPHGELCASAPSGYFSAVVVGLDPGIATFRWIGPDDRSHPVPYWALPCPGPVSDQLARYLDDVAANRSASPGFQDSIMHAVVLLMLDLIKSTTEQISSQSPAVSNKVERCLEIIQGELANPELGVGRLARCLRCTPNHLSRLFSTECGISLNAYIRNERLRQAQLLLTDPSLNVSEIAWACGFRSANYFIRRFRAAHGSTPGSLQHAQLKHRSTLRRTLATARVAD